MMKQIGWFVVLTIFCSVKTSSAYSCSNKYVEVLGQSSSLVKPVFAAALQSFSDFRRNLKYNTTVKLSTLTNYVSTGLIGVVNRSSPVFTATHSIFTLHNNEVKFPFLAQPVVIIYNIPGTSSLNLSLDVISLIYSGIITYWDDDNVQKLNPKFDMPHERIIPVARQDSDSSTRLFTQILSVRTPAWKSGLFSSPLFVDGICCNSTSWPARAELIYGNGTVGVVGFVNSYKYSLGYATQSTVIQYEINVASISQNNTTIDPTNDAMNKAIASYVDDDPNSLNVNLDANLSVDAYPLCAFSYMVVNLTYDSSIDCCTIQELAGFVDWFFQPSNDDLLNSLGFVPIIDEFQKRIQRVALSKMRCNEGFVYPLYVASLTPAYNMETWQVAIIVIVTCLFVAAALGVIYYMYYTKYHVDESRWLIEPSRIRISEEKSHSFHGTIDLVSEHSHSLSINLPGHTDKKDGKSHSTSTHAESQRKLKRNVKEFMIRGEFDENKIYLSALQCKIPQQWSVFTKRSLGNRLKNVINKNVSTLLGITVIGSNPFTVFDFCAKGTLHYILQTSRYKFTDEIKFQFAFDIAQGLKYLHHYGLFHGYLSSLTCYLDSSWTVKIFQWEKLTIYEEENYRNVMDHAHYTNDTILEESRLIELLYVHPELSKKVDESVDIYSFGLLLVEIFTRQLPFTEEVEHGEMSYSEILEKKFTKRALIRPRANKISRDIDYLSAICLASDDRRPNMAKVCTQLMKNSRHSNGIVDIIMDTLESHADALEEKVDERTAELQQVTTKMRHLLNEVLPPQIAEKLLSGQPVLPEQFQCITVYFSDIVGFTTISARSTPTEVMTFLNDLWLAFDSVIEKFDAYKVDTIGDAYMVCSGLPIRNGMEHLKQISLLSLALLEHCNIFKIKHLPTEQLKVRIGMNSGPATAGVVGSKMPQYCVFGDTVNTAARMESTSSPQKIQMSENTFDLLNKYFPGQFITTPRGEIEVKGKGQMKTYWLIEQVK